MTDTTQGRFAGCHAVVTGGSRGIGLAITRRLVDEGAEVLIAARDERAVRAAAEGLDRTRVVYRAGDLAEPAFCDELIEAAAARWRRIDVLVNNAGLFHEARILEIDLDKWRYVMDVMVQAPLRLAQRAAAVMVTGGGGAIVNVGSIDARHADGPYASYAAAKAALLQLTRNLAVELAPAGIRANTVSPGWTLTPMADAAWPPEQVERITAHFARAPMGRLVTPDEVAAAVCFLASDDASGITGTDLVVDCGTLADLYVLPTLPDTASQ